MSTKARFCSLWGQKGQDRDGAELWEHQMRESDAGRNWVSSGGPGGIQMGKATGQGTWQGAAWGIPFVFLHLHSDGVELPLAPALRVRIRDSLNLPGAEGERAGGWPHAIGIQMPREGCIVGRVGGHRSGIRATVLA